jgi:UPF0176 protein
LTPIQNPQKWILDHKKFFKERDVTCRIYINEEGINAQMSGTQEAIKEYKEWLRSDPQFRDVFFKTHNHFEQAFPRKTVKYRKQLVAFDLTVDLKNRGVHLSPEKWKEMLEEKKVVLDIRNDYEWDLGHFEGASRPICENSRGFKAYTEDLLSKIDKKSTPVMMYCTGGIRCEYYSALLKERGVEQVYQLDGGVINYGLEVGSDHWKGKLFVFDDRLAVPLKEGEETEVIGRCHKCKTASDRYYNCAHMDCNALFLSCQGCLDQLQGCCSEECTKASHVRPYAQCGTHKPFRRKHHYV